jgi:hypothetical protein
VTFSGAFPPHGGLKNMKPCIFALVVLLLAGCQQGPYTTLQSSNGNGENSFTYGRYFENDRIVVGNAIMVEAFITLGPERLPKGYRPTRPVDYADGEVEAVMEFRFTNLTDKPVELKIENFGCELYPGAIQFPVMQLPPKQSVKSVPLIGLTTNFIIEPWKYTMTLAVNGQRFLLHDQLIRLTTDQLKARHG